VAWGAAALSVAALGYGACGLEQDEAEVADASARRELLSNLGEHVILATYEEFSAAAQKLDAALAAYADAPGETTRTAAQMAFVEALRVWERAEVYQLGPAADVTNFNPGALGLRAEIYAWQDANPCVVDRGLINKSYESDDFEGDVYPYGRDLSAIERLLFSTEAATACPASDKVVTAEAWAALGNSELTERRARYAASAGAVVTAKAKQLVKAFRDDFLPELTQAGEGSKLFDRTQEALNAVTNALFYIDFDVRDMKLGGPLGHSADCASGGCPTELPYAKQSKQAVIENLIALRAMFEGHLPDAEPETLELAGLNDLLVSVGAESLVKSIDAAISEAQGAVEKVEPNFEEALRAPDAAMSQAFDALQALADLLKTEFLQKLALNPPMRASGDND
jgi:predicted lipoprotein